jgi:hypothetical protein
MPPDPERQKLVERRLRALDAQPKVRREIRN